MTDDEYRVAAKRLKLWGLLESAGHAGLGADTFTTRHTVGDAAYKIGQRLLELLPPPDDAEPITAEWLQAVGFERGDKFETLSIDLIEGNMLHYSPTLGWWWLSAKHGDKVSAGMQPTRAHVRQLCASFGTKLKETA